jgi:hypothetical protein
MAQSKAVGWKTVVIAFAAIPLMIAAFMWMDARPSTPTQLTAGQRQSLEAALQAAGLPAAKSIAVDGKRLIADFDLYRDADLALLVTAGLKSPREFGMKAVITIRNASVPFGFIDRYRVNVNGEPPGPGLISRVGSATFIEGGRAEWQESPSR